MMGQQHFMNHHLGTYMKNSINKIENKKNLNEGNFYFPVMENYSKLDDEFIIAYHPSLGVLCDEWMNMLVRYGTTRGRDMVRLNFLHLGKIWDEKLFPTGSPL